MSTSSLIQPPRELWLRDAQQDQGPRENKLDYPGRLWVALRRYWRLAAVIVVLGMALASIVLSLVPPVYSSTATIMIDGRDAQVGNVGNFVSGPPIDVSTVTNEVQVLTSRTLIGALVQELGLENDPNYDPNRVGRLRLVSRRGLAAVEPWLPGAAAEALRSMVDKPALTGREYTDAVINAVEKGLSVGPVGRSRAITITFTAGQPVIAERLANTMARLYLENQTEMKRRAAETTYDRITAKLAGLQSAAAEAAQQVEIFRVKSSLIDGRDTSLIRQQVSEVSTQLTTAELDRLSTASRLRDVERAATRPGGDTSSEVLKSPLIQQLRLQQVQIARDVAQAQIVYGERDTRGQVASSQLGAIERRIDQEVQKTLVAIRGEHEAAIDREGALRARMDRLKRDMAEVRASEVQLSQLEQNAGATREVYEAFLRRAKETDVGSTMQSPDAYIISNATIPTSPISPNIKVGIPVGFVMSSILAFVVILALEVRDGGFLSQSHVNRVLGLQTIGMIPDLSRHNRVPDLRSLVGTAVTDLYMRIILAPENRCILMTSAFPGEGKTSIGLTLARVAAYNGKRSIFIDCDMRRAQSRQSAAEVGLSELLTGRAGLDDVISADEVTPGVSVLTAGGPVENPSGLVSSANMRELLQYARRSFDLVIIDAPPVLVGPEAWMLALRADTTLLFVKWSRTPTKAVLAAHQKLTEVGARVSGVVLTMVDLKRIQRYAPVDAIHLSKMGSTYSSDRG